MEKNAYIDELTLITIPFSEIDVELSTFMIINTHSDEIIDIKSWQKCSSRWRYEIYLSEPIKLGNSYKIRTNDGFDFTVLIGQVVRTKAFDDLYYYNDHDLGATYSKQRTLFKLWAPTATEVELVFYEKGQEIHYPLVRSDKGIWQRTFDGDLDETEYTYRVNVDNKWREAVDPYAKAVTVNGEKGVVVDLLKTNPINWEQTKNPLLKQPTDAIIYEVHVRDFSIDKTSGMKAKGKYKAFTEVNTTGPWGTTTGLDYLVELGITHVQLLPIQDFGSVDETNPLQEYNWGYDTVHYNALEGSYSLIADQPKERIKEFKEVVSTFHENGLRVILDVVYNHVYVHHKSHFENLVPGYYFRYESNGGLADGTGVGNDIASERKMVRKFIVDSVSYLATEYKVDGFRFDLMGILDVDTMQTIRHRLNEIDPTILIIGEGWDLATPLSSEKKATIYNSDQLTGISQFNDQFRDKLKGNIFNQKIEGFCNGNSDLKDDCKVLLSGSVKGFLSQNGIFDEPYKSVNYVECHDNHTLWDKLAIANGDQPEADRASMHRLATAMTILSQGIPFLHAGQEFYRSKNGVENSYNSLDEINKIDWQRKALHMDYVDYVKALIAIRKKYSVFRIATNDLVKKNMHILDTPIHVVAYMLKGSTGIFVVAFNGGQEERELILPVKGLWEVLVEGDKASLSPFTSFEGAKYNVRRISTAVLFHPKPNFSV